ncbi:DUF2382 domain-containing protein [Cereibacter azotoformans]|uniref:DUF2382 domain-containing protein n=1 Tax=Cereibacter azotoformans TaxID=43057 RepID=UPI000C6DC837
MSKPSRSAPEVLRESRVIPIVEEQAVIHTRKMVAEGVRVRTVVHEEEAVIDTPVTRETLDVELVPSTGGSRDRSRCARRATPRSSPSGHAG